MSFWKIHCHLLLQNKPKINNKKSVKDFKAMSDRTYSGNIIQTVNLYSCVHFLQMTRFFIF